MTIDVFLCYRRHSAQTAKLFKRYLTTHRFVGEVWYSDGEVYGNYKMDIPTLIGNAKCAVVFIDPGFTDRFLDSNESMECITALEIVQILIKKRHDDAFRLLTVFVDRPNGLTESESNTIRSLLENAGVEHPQDAVMLISQSNAVFFSTAKDNEDELFSAISRKMLPDSYYSTHTPRGNFFFGSRQTSADVVIWDSTHGIDLENIFFENSPLSIPLHKRIERCRSNLSFEPQNSTMVSLTGMDAVLDDETEAKIVSIRYQQIAYRLFYKTLSMWDQFELHKVISEFDWHSDLYQIPNAMGLAFMVITSDDQMVFTRRSAKRRVRPSEYDCSIVEGLKLSGCFDNETYGISDERYLEHEIRRAFREEICVSCGKLKIKIFGLVLDKQYGQWNLVGTIHTDLTSATINGLYALRDDTYEDNQILFIPFKDESGMLSLHPVERSLRVFLGEGMWDMALTAIYAGLLSVGFTNLDITDMSNRLF